MALSRVTESSSTELCVSVSVRWIGECIMNISVSADSSDLSLFLLLFIPLSDLFLSPSPTMNLIITHYFDIPPVRIGFHAISWLPPLSSRLCRSSSHPTVPYHYYEPSGPNECSMYLSHERNRRGSHHRFITEKAVFANWARTRDIHFYQPDWKPSPIVTTVNGSYTANPAGSWNAPQRRSPEMWNMCVDGFQRSDSLSGQYEYTRQQQDRASCLWLLADCLSSLAEWDHCVTAAQSLNNALEV